MSVAVMRKTTREAALLLLIALGAVVVFELLLVRALGDFADEITDIWFKRMFLRNLVKALVGADLAENITPTSLVTLGFAHPVLYTFIWGFLLATGSRIIAGEIDNGTADLLLTLPLSRARVYASVSSVWVLAGIPLCLAPLLGIWLGELVSPMREPLELARLRITPVNLFALYLAIGCGTMLVSTVVARRGLSIGIVLAALLASFFLSFLTQFWPLAKRVGFLGILDYYRPLESVRTGAWPLRELAVLGGSAVVLWLAGLAHFCRRDIRAA